ncbi:hypothetical protein ACQPZJ_44305 [Actinoplanes sp. CA-054009]
MTIGFWRAEAQAALRATATAMTGQSASSAAAINAAIAARSAVYTQLARVTELLAGGRPFQDGSTTANTSLVVGRHGQGQAQLYAGLQAAALADHHYPSSPASGSTEGASLRRAADAVGVIGDILASHVTPGQRPRTPEGAAIQAGGGVQAALADICRLTIAALEVDQQISDWLPHGFGPLTAVYRPVAGAARRATSGHLDMVARELIASSAGQPRLLDELEVARQPLDPAPAVTTADEARAAVDSARTWLWQHRDQSSAIHLQLGTQLGLALYALGADPDPAVLGQWRGAAASAAELRGTPPVDVGRHVASELAEVLRWARAQLNAAVRAPAEDLARLSEQLPILASTLHRGCRHAVERRDLFVRKAVLRRPAGSVVYRVTERWRPAISSDDDVRTVNEYLSGLYRQQKRPASGGRTRPEAAVAFPQPPRPRADTTGPGPAGAPPLPGSTRRRGPSR